MKPWKSLKRLVGVRKEEKIPIPPHRHADADTHPVAAMQRSTALDCERRLEIIAAYGKVLEQCASPVEPEAALPFPKELIRQAIYDELAENPETELRNPLEIAFVQLESFLPSEEYEIVFNFKLADCLAREIAKSGAPKDIISSARILQEVKGEHAVRIQERISEEMGKRLEQIRATGTYGIIERDCS